MAGKTKQNAAELLVKCLETQGVQYIFGLPGEENLAFLEALRTSKIKLILTRNEQAAAFMAATVGRMTGQAGAAFSTLGPGATNLLTGAAYATLGGFPLLLITGQKPIRRSKQGKFQIVDIGAMMRPVTKFSATITSGGQVPPMVREAMRLAETEPPGAAHLELPEDIAEESAPAKPIFPSEIKYTPAKPKAVAQATIEIEKSKRPLIVVGGTAHRRNIRQALEKFLQKTGLPFVSTPTGKGALDENSPLYLGTASLSAGDYAHQAMGSADTLIFIGHDVINAPPVILGGGERQHRKIIHINFFSSTAPNVYVPTHEVIGDIGKTLSALAEKIRINPNWDFSYFPQVRDALKKNIESFSRALDFPMRPERIAADIEKAMPGEGFIALDNGMYKIYLARNFTAKAGRRVLLDNTLATMGAGLPSGIALKILEPRKKVLVVSGDGGLMMNIGELETAVRLRLDLVVLVLDDSGFGMIKWKQKKMRLPSFGLSFSNPDFVRLAESFGATGHKISKAENLAPFLQKTLSTKGVHVITCPISYEKSNETLKVPGQIESKALSGITLK